MRFRLRPLIVGLSGVILATASLRGATIDDTFHSPLFTREAPTGSGNTYEDSLRTRRVIVLQDDSFISFGGFTRLDGMNVGGIVKFRANGSRDLTFHFPDGYSSISAGAVTSDGHFIVAALQQDKSSRNFYRILELNANGSIDPTFNAGSGANNIVRTVKLDSSGKILLGGYFTKFNGTNRSCLLRLNANGSIDGGFAAPSFEETNPYFLGSEIRAIAIQPTDGKFVIGGNFSSINGVPRSSIARLNRDGSVDTTFVPSGFTLYEQGTQHENSVRDVALQFDGRILVAGRFATGQPFPNDSTSIIRLNTDGSFESFFGPIDHSMHTVMIKTLSNGDVLYSDYLIYRTDADGNVLPGYPRDGFSEAGPLDFTRIYNTDVQSDGALLVAGPGLVDGQKRSGLARLKADLTLDSFNAGEFQSEVAPENVGTAANGKIYVSGNFDRVDGRPRTQFARLLPNGQLDSAFDPGPALGLYKGIGFVLSPDGKVVLCGKEYDRFGDLFIAKRFKATGEIDTTFEPYLDDYEYDGFNQGVVEDDGSYLAASAYSAPNIVNGYALRRFAATGYPDNHFFYSLPKNAVEEDGFGGPVIHIWIGETKVMALLGGGRFLAKYFDKTGNYHLVRMTNEMIDSTFHEGTVRALNVSESFDATGGAPPVYYHPATIAPGSPISDVALLPDGKIMVVGMFTKYNNTSAPGIVRLLSNGVIDPTFHPGAGAQWTTTQTDADHIPHIQSIKLQQNGQLLIAGNFEAYAGKTLPGIALLNADGTPDSIFNPAIALRDFGPFVTFPEGKLYRQGAGNYLVTGRYANAGEANSRSLLRIKLPASAEALNISTRMKVETGDNVMIGGFIITGSEPKRVIIRGIGPSLASSGISGALADPVLELHKADGTIVNNDNWKSSQQAEIQETGIPPQNNLEPAIVATLPAGRHTAILRGKNNTTGIGLIEVYDLDQVADARLANISSRGFVEAGDDVMIGGIVVGPIGTNNGKVIIRAIGPSLGTAGVDNPLLDPTLELRNSSGQLIAFNDNWKSNQQAAIQATGIPPTSDKESAIVATLAPGRYTAIVRGKDNAAGVALVEAYRIQ